MKARRPMLLLIAALIIVTLLVMACASRSKQAPGLANGKLSPCPGTPNCVSSEDPAENSQIDPFTFEGAPEGAWSRLKQAILAEGGSIEKDDDIYLWATFTSRLFHFVDDVEFRLDAANRLIHVRSASRVGYSDMGVNRKRVEALRKTYTHP